MALGYITFLSLDQVSYLNTNYNLTELLLTTLLFVIVSISEEVLMCGYILKNLMTSFNKYVGLIVSSLLFSLMHGINPNVDWLSMLNLFLADILVGASYIYTRNLWFPIALHLS